MRQLSFLAIVLLLALSGCCGVRFHDRSFSSDCPPDGAESMSCPPVGVALKAHGARLRGLWNHATHVPPAAPVPPPNPKYHPVPTRPVFAPLP
jgi:hypothetical protein